MFLHTLRLTTKMRGSFSEKMFKHYPAVILCDDMLEVFVGGECSRKKDGVGNGLGKCSGYNNVSLKVFVMEELFHRRE